MADAGDALHSNDAPQIGYVRPLAREKAPPGEALYQVGRVQAAWPGQGLLTNAEASRALAIMPLG